MNNPTPVAEKVAYRVKEATRAYGVGRSWLYSKMAEGKLDTVKIGGVRLIPRASLDALLSLEAAN